MIISHCTFVFLHFLSWLLLLSRWSMVSWKSASSWRKGMSRLLNYFSYSETTRICFFYSFSHICKIFKEMRRKTDTYWKLQGSRREPVRILCCQFFEKWNGRSVHCHRALQKTDCWESETDWNELWAHKFTLRAWKPIVTTSLTIHEDD